MPIPWLSKAVPTIAPFAAEFVVRWKRTPSTECFPLPHPITCGKRQLDFGRATTHAVLRRAAR